MARAEKKTTAHLQAVNPEDAPTAEPATKGRATEEVAAPRRRTFTAEFKRQILAEADACTESGDVGALLRRHGLYSSHLTEWRRQRDEGALSGLAPRKRGRKAQVANPLAVSRRAFSSAPGVFFQGEDIEASENGSTRV